MKRFAVLFMALALVGLFAASHAAHAADKQVPTKITSESMRYSQDGGSVVFEGKVFVNRPDMRIWARKLTVYFAEGGKKSATPGDTGEIEKIVAQGSVRLEREGKQGTCDKATYQVGPGVLVMEGDPQLADGDNSITGRVIRLYLKDNRSEVEGGGGKQVEAIFMTPAGAE